MLPVLPEETRTHTLKPALEPALEPVHILKSVQKSVSRFTLLPVFLAAFILMSIAPLSPVDAKTVIIGKVISRQSGDIAARIAAPVMGVNVVGGDRVSKGDILAFLNVDDRKADLEKAAAGVRVAEARLQVKRAALDLEKAKFQRLDRLKTSAAFNAAQHGDSQIEIRRLEAELTVAWSEIVASQAAYDRIAIDIKRAEVIAPYDAIVVSRAVEEGDYVAAGQKLFTLVSTSELEIEADLPTSIASRVKPGMKIDATTRDGRELEVTLRAVIPIENPLTRTRVARFTLGNSEGLAIGQSVELRINDE